MKLIAQIFEKSNQIIFEFVFDLLERTLKLIHIFSHFHSINKSYKLFTVLNHFENGNNDLREVQEDLQIDSIKINSKKSS